MIIANLVISGGLLKLRER